MSSTTFINGTVIAADWLNDANTVLYTYFGNGTNLNSPTKLQVAQGVFSTSIITPKLQSSDAVSGVSLGLAGGFNRIDWSGNGIRILNTSDAFGNVTCLTLTANTSVVTALGDLRGVVSPKITFTPSSGSTRIGSFYQNGDTIFMAQDGVSNRILMDLATGNISPAVDNVATLGSGSFRWSTGFFSSTVTARDFISDTTLNSGISFKTGATVNWAIINRADTANAFQIHNGSPGIGAQLLDINHTTGAMTVVSVNTPIVLGGGTNDLILGAGISSHWVIPFANGFLTPFNDNSQNFGSPTKRIATVFTPIIDSGTTGSLSLKTNNGTTGILLTDTVSGVNFLTMGGAPTTGQPSIGAAGTDSSVGLLYFTKGTGVHTFNGNSAAQFQIIPAASATRNITVTGSNGGNPLISTTAGNVAIGPSGAANLILNSTVVGLGGSSPSSNGTGITFPATQNASTDVNTLDDYEEGTFTPSLGGTTSYNLQEGTYTKIGRLVFINIRLNINTIGTGSTVLISGLPFTATNGGAAGTSNVSAAATAVVSLTGRINAGQTDIQMMSRTIAAVAESGNAIFGNGTALTLSGCFQV